MPRTAIISDIHANLHALCAVCEDFELWGCAEVVCLGDIVGYNAFPHECLDYVRNRASIVVKGNHDADVVELYRELYGIPVREETGTETSLAREYKRPRVNSEAEESLKWTAQQLSPEDIIWLDKQMFSNVRTKGVAYVHASLEDPRTWHYILSSEDAGRCFAKQIKDICFHGHTHVPRAFMWERSGSVVEYDVRTPMLSSDTVTLPLQAGYKYCINVGSLGQSRDGDCRASYAIYDSDANTVYFRRVPYDVEGACDAIRAAAGLPDSLADRLKFGV